jgi:hypothetical protein
VLSPFHASGENGPKLWPLAPTSEIGAAGNRTFTFLSGANWDNIETAEAGFESQNTNSVARRILTLNEFSFVSCELSFANLRGDWTKRNKDHAGLVFKGMNLI